MKNATLYWIRLNEHTDITVQGYVGVSYNYIKRFKSHIKECKKRTHANPHLIHAYHKYGEAALIIEEIFSGTVKDCYLEELKLRPNSNIGWNVAPGGHRGPGRIKGSEAQKTATAKGKLTVQQRKDRIASKNLTADDILFIERQKERKQLLELLLKTKQEIKQQKQESKIRIKQQKQIEKQKLKEEERRKKVLARTSGCTITDQQSRPLCQLCHSTPVKQNGVSKHGFVKWHKYCATCSKVAYSEQHQYLKNKKLICDCCGFKAKDSCQMDLVYKDGNVKNKVKTNLQTYCANCYKLYKKNLKVKKLLNITVDADVLIN